ncbi:MAG: hypothetical protein EAZ66_02905 [Alphaproteobacteria bacterium]|nr:MAG: hypothetical protein EAZ66_02905 [Alphaproteobacteria bacterium]
MDSKEALFHATNGALVAALIFDVATIIPPNITSHDERQLLHMNENMLTREFHVGQDRIEMLTHFPFSGEKLEQEINELIALFHLSYHGLTGLTPIYLQEMRAKSATYCAVLYRRLNEQATAFMWVERAIEAYTPISLMVYDPNDEWYRTQTRAIKTSELEVARLQTLTQRTAYENFMLITHQTHLALFDDTLLHSWVASFVPHEILYGPTVQFLQDNTPLGHFSWIPPALDEWKRNMQQAKAWFVGDPQPEQQEKLNRQHIAALADAARQQITKLEALKESLQAH